MKRAYTAALPRPFFVLAPMDDVTDSVFRRVVASCAPPDVLYTEFVNVDGLQSPGREKLVKKIFFTEEERAGKPLVAQLWGKNPDNFRKTAAELVEMGFAGIDLNMGCPAKSEVRNGTCSALINNRPLAAEIIRATQAGVTDAVAAGHGRRVPVSVKTRLGFSVVDLTWHEFLLGFDLDMLVVHGRTRKEMSKVPANWDLIGQVRQLRDRLAPATLMVGNGDVRDRAHGLELAARYGLDGVMIGRGIFHDPYAFAEPVTLPPSGTALGSAYGSPWQLLGRQERIALFRRHVAMFDETWRLPADTATGDDDGSVGQSQAARYQRPIHTLNKFCKIYINGFDGAKELRERLMAADSTDELLALLDAAA